MNGVASLRMRADADALSDPDRAGAEHAPKFARARQVDPVT
jgi:hypothetical protein